MQNNLSDSQQCGLDTHGSALGSAVTNPKILCPCSHHPANHTIKHCKRDREKIILNRNYVVSKNKKMKVDNCKIVISPSVINCVQQNT
jgi:hypothetical protein